jgi:hypothetical protein
MAAVTAGTDRTQHAVALLAIVSILWAVTACGSAVPSPSPSASGASSPAVSLAPDRWVVAKLDLPSEVTTAPSLEPGYQCHPCHFLAENELFDVADTSTGPIAVGVQQPPAQAIAFTSSDLKRWTPVPGFSGRPGTSALGIVASGDRTVIVGQSPTGATSWSSEGSGWESAPDQEVLHVSYGGGAMMAVTVLDNEFVAGGYHDSPLAGTKAAAVWRSDDGLKWRADRAAGTFEGGRILDLVAAERALIAVGTNGDPTYGPAAAWRWTPSEGWKRANLQPDDRGAMASVAVVDGRFVAVGTNAADNGARVWTSRDGLTWTVAPDQPALHAYDRPARMHSVTPYPGGLAAAGLRFDAGNGSAVVWTSPDGATWESAWETSFSGGEMDGLAVSADSLVAVGRTGYPDWNTATIWVTPAR